MVATAGAAPRERKEIDQRYKWNGESVFPGGYEEWDAEFAALSELGSKPAAFQGPVERGPQCAGRFLRPA